MISEHQTFLNYVYEYVRENPEIAPNVVQMTNTGLSEALKEARERAADFEALLLISFQTPKQLKNDHEYIKQKLIKWRGKSALVWDWFLNKND